LWNATVSCGTSASRTATRCTTGRTDRLRNELADFVRFHAWNALRHHPGALDLFFARNTASDSLGHHERFLTADRVRNAAGLGFGDSTAGLDRNSTGALFRYHLADLVRDPLSHLFADHTAGLDRNLFHDGFIHDPADLNWNLGDDGFGNLTADRHWYDLLADNWLIGRAGDLSANNIRTPDGSQRVETARYHGQSRVSAFISHASGEAEAGVPGSLQRPLATIFLNGAIGGDRLHHRVATFLVDRFADIADDRAAAFPFDRFGHRTLNAATDFTSRFFPDRLLDSVVAFAVQRLCHGSHHRVLLFTISRLDHLMGDLVLLFAIRCFNNVAVARGLHVFVRCLIDSATDGVGLCFLNVLVDCPLTLLSFDATCRVTRRRLTNRCRTTAIACRSTVAPGRRGRCYRSGQRQRNQCANHSSAHVRSPQETYSPVVCKHPDNIPTGIAYVDSSV